MARRASLYSRLCGGWLAAFALMFATESAWARTWPDFPHPADSRVEWVADRMVFNGVSIRVQRLLSQEPPETVLRFYRDHWAPVRVVENRVGNWRVLGLRRGDFFWSVQVRPAAAGGTEAFLSLTPLDEMKAPHQLGGGFPLMRDSTVLNDMHSQDGARTARTLFLKNHYSVEMNALFYREQMLGSGWSRAQDRTRKPGRSRVLRFTRPNGEMAILLNRKGDQTTILANEVHIENQ